MKLKKDVAYQCKTEIAAKAFLKEAEKLDWKWWGTGEKPTSNIRYEKYLAETCYMYFSDFSGLSYGRKSDFEEDNIKIIEYIPKLLEGK